MKLAIALVLCAGCDSVLGLDPVAPPQGLVCKNVSPAPFECADFDESDAIAYERGIAVQLPAPGANVTIDRRGPAVSRPNALWIDSSGGTYGIDQTPAAPTGITKLHATLAVQFARVASNIAQTSLVEIGVRDVAYDHCYVAVQIEPEPHLIMQSHCGLSNPNDINRYTNSLSPLPQPGDWAALVFDYDVAAGVATLSLDDQMLGTLDVGFQAPTGGTPHVAAGVLDGTMPEIAFDDLVVTMQ